jgi:hypothetical protein
VCSRTYSPYACRLMIDFAKWRLRLISGEGWPPNFIVDQAGLMDLDAD